MRKPKACERSGPKLPAEQVSAAVVLAASFTMQRNAFGATARRFSKVETHSACVVGKKDVQHDACSTMLMCKGETG